MEWSYEKIFREEWKCLSNPHNLRAILSKLNGFNETRVVFCKREALDAIFYSLFMPTINSYDPKQMQAKDRFDKIRFTSYCPACAQATESRGEVISTICPFCPLDWGGPLDWGAGNSPCLDKNSLYVKFEDAINKGNFYTALDYARQISEMPWNEVERSE